jgi:xanthine dehydrogenase accessory factor
MAHLNFKNYLDTCKELQTAQENFAVATLVHIEGSSPQDVGARIIIRSDGEFYGTIGGGKLENTVLKKAAELLSTKTPNALIYHFFSWNLQTDIGMTCGGKVHIFFELFQNSAQWNIAVFGAGHVGQELVRLLLPLNCSVYAIDSRLDWLNKLPSSANLKTLQCDPMEEALLQIPENSNVVIMTMGHSTDLPILHLCFKDFNFPYIGNMGSELKSKKLKHDLLELGIHEEKIKNLHCPIGEKMGSNHPYEIALSVVTQLIKQRDLSENLQRENHAI